MKKILLICLLISGCDTTYPISGEVIIGAEKAYGLTTDKVKYETSNGYFVAQKGLYNIGDTIKFCR